MNRHLICLFFLVLFSLKAIAQDIVVPFNRLTVNEGLSSQDRNFYLHLDQRGFQWISSSAGLNRFDGHTVKKYRANRSVPTSIAEPSASRSRFMEIPGRGLFFCNGQYFIRYDRKKDHFERINFISISGDTIKGDHFWNYFDQRRREFWIGIDNAIYTVPVDSFHRARLAIPHRSVIKSKMFYGDDGDLHHFRIGSEVPFVEVFSFNKAEGRLVTEEKIVTPDNATLHDLTQYSDEEIYVGTSTGLKKYDRKRDNWESFSGGYQGVEINDVYLVVPYRKEEMLVSSAGNGVFIFNRDQGRFTGRLLNYENGELHTLDFPVDRIHVDPSENIWISTANNGILYGSPHKVKFGQVYPGDEGDYIQYRGFAESGNQLFVLTYQGVIVRSVEGEKFYPLPVSGVEVGETIFIKADSQGRIWVGTLEWLFKFNDLTDTFEKVDLLPRKMSNLPGYISLTELPNGDLLFGTNENKILKVEYNLKRAEWIETSLQSTHGACFSKGFLLTSDTRSRFRVLKSAKGGFELDTTINNAPSFNTILQDEVNERYWGVSTSGLYEISLLEGEWSLKKVRKLDFPLFSGVVSNKGNVWCGAANGILQYRPDEDAVVVYSTTDGLQAGKFALNSAFIRSDGEIIFGGTKGYNTFLEDEITSRLPSARPTITRVSINGENLPLERYENFKYGDSIVRKIELLHQENNLSIELASLEYSNPKNTKFRYWLSGADYPMLQQLPQGNIINLANLKSGNFLLEVQASNSDGEWASQKAVLLINILPPWYRTWYAYLLYVSIIAAIAFTIFRYRLRQIRRLEKQQLRTAQAEARTAETETAVLRLQMNPHFIANGLNAVNNYILGKEVRKANKYLGAFAHLTREILERSEQQLSTLQDAIQLLEKYLEAEQLRLDGKLSYRIEEDPELDVLVYALPTMLLQPFVENAIWHGLSGLDRGGEIVLRFGFGTNGRQLLTEVEDNGRGRAATAGKRAAHKKISSLDITRRRLRLLNEQARNEEGEQPPARLEIRDKQATDGTPLGTHILIYLPLITAS